MRCENCGAEVECRECDQSQVVQDALAWKDEAVDEKIRLMAENRRLKELVDGAKPIVELWQTFTPAGTAWKGKWLEKAKGGVGMTDSTVRRSVEIEPAFDKRSPNPSKNCGIHGVNLKFLLSGLKGVVQFVIYTNWHLPHVQEELDDRRKDHYLCHPMPADLGYHSPIPLYEGQMEIECCYLPGGKCYYDGSGLMAHDVFKIMVEKGGEAMWEVLQRRYDDLPETGYGEGI